MVSRCHFIATLNLIRVVHSMQRKMCANFLVLDKFSIFVRFVWSSVLVWLALFLFNKRTVCNLIIIHLWLLSPPSLSLSTITGRVTLILILFVAKTTAYCVHKFVVGIHKTVSITIKFNSSSTAMAATASSHN